MSEHPRITAPDDPALDELCAALSERADSVEDGRWPQEQLDLCGQAGVYEWFLPTQWGGQQWSDVDIIRGYLRLSAACLTTTFIITQRTGACRRIAACDNLALKEELLPKLLTKDSFATLGISHLTTSHRHLAKPVQRAEPRDGGVLLDGFSPWVTGGPQADIVVTGAVTDDGRQVLVALPMDLPGIDVREPAQLVALAASHTGPVHYDKVFVDEKWLIAGPGKDVMASGVGGKTGGVQTSTLAIGVATSAIAYIAEQATARPELQPACDQLRAECDQLQSDLIGSLLGTVASSNDELRTRANSLVLRATQAALTAAKGAGYIIGHPVGRWCREALFFLVWSCPQSVMEANLCELAGIETV
ncbi:MAG: acyl-CoA/acyl-ACP dehydrogenase [Planctomycetes bacterium]|nr:acyl-CoA/acyl-ACP dehydrogenase [Planctomycetota bacterium]